MPCPSFVPPSLLSRSAPFCSPLGRLVPRLVAEATAALGRQSEASLLALGRLVIAPRRPRLTTAPRPRPGLSAPSSSRPSTEDRRTVDANRDILIKVRSPFLAACTLACLSFPLLLRLPVTGLVSRAVGFATRPVEFGDFFHAQCHKRGTVDSTDGDLLRVRGCSLAGQRTKAGVARGPGGIWATARSGAGSSSLAVDAERTSVPD